MHQSVNGVKKGRSSRALQFTNKLTSEELKVTGTWPLLANVASFMKMNVIGFMQLGKYPVITKYYDHEFLKSNSVTNFSQNNAVENYRKYQKKQGSTIIMAWSLIIMEWS